MWQTTHPKLRRILVLWNCTLVRLFSFRHCRSHPYFSSFQWIPIVVLSQSRLYLVSIILFPFSWLFSVLYSFKPLCFSPLTSLVHFFPQLPVPPCAPSLSRPISNPRLVPLPSPRSPALALFCACLPLFVHNSYFPVSRGSRVGFPVLWAWFPPTPIQFNIFLSHVPYHDSPF